jgi:hypothetical protein
MQVGGTLGTAILGSIMSAKVGTLLPAQWSAAHLPAISSSQLGALKSLVSVGVAPVQQGDPPQVASELVRITHEVFSSGMSAAFLVAAIVALAGAGVALLTRAASGHGDRPAEAGHVAAAGRVDHVQSVSDTSA